VAPLYPDDDLYPDSTLSPEDLDWGGQGHSWFLLEVTSEHVEPPPAVGYVPIGDVSTPTTYTEVMTPAVALLDVETPEVELLNALATFIPADQLTVETPEVNLDVETPIHADQIDVQEP